MPETEKCKICGNEGPIFDDGDDTDRTPYEDDLIYCDTCGDLVCYSCLALTNEHDGTDECKECDGTGGTGKPKAAIIGANGNVFNIMGIATKALKKAGKKDQAAELQKRVMASGSYDAALAIIQEYVDPVEAH